MATPSKYNSFVEELWEGGHSLQTDTIKIALTNTAPAATDTAWSTGVYPAPTSANGYTAGGNTITVSSSAQTSGTQKTVWADSTFTASGGQLGPFRYIVAYNSSKSNKIINYLDYGSSITLNDTETFTVDYDASNGAATLA